MTTIYDTIIGFFGLCLYLAIFFLPLAWFHARDEKAAAAQPPPVDTEDWPPEIKEYDRIHGHLPPREEVIAACIRNHHWDDL